MRYSEASQVQKLKHLTHLEDLVFEAGLEGVHLTIDLVEDLLAQLGGNTPAKLKNVTVKYDGCFSPNTLIETERGSIAISEVVDAFDQKKPLRVWTWNHKTNQKELSNILGASRGPGFKTWIRLTLEDETEILCTEDHPFFDKNSQTYIEAHDLLKNNDIVLLSDKIR